MVSRKQLETNRANAKLSTGPKSDAGRARSRMNALKHGFSSQEIVLEGEDAGHCVQGLTQNLIPTQL
jgi:hypothetical protein